MDVLGHNKLLHFPFCCKYQYIIVHIESSLKFTFPDFSTQKSLDAEEADAESKKEPQVFSLSYPMLVL